MPVETLDTTYIHLIKYWKLKWSTAFRGAEQQEQEGWDAEREARVIHRHDPVVR